MSTYGLTNWISVAKKIKDNEDLSWEDAQLESKKRLKIGQYKEGKIPLKLKVIESAAQPPVQPHSQPYVQPNIQLQNKIASSKIPHRTIYRDNFHGISQAFIKEKLGRNVDYEEKFRICNLLEKHIPPLIKDLLVEAISNEDDSSLEKFIITNKINTENKFPMAKSNRILVEIVQDKLKDFEAEHTKNKFKSIREKFNPILYFLVSNYLNEYDKAK